MYDYTKAKDLIEWAKEQYTKPNRYKNGGIGRYDADGTRQFDCCGLFKCFMWHDYHTKNAAYYGKTQKDLNCEGLIAEAKEKGPIDTIPEIPGILVYQNKHMGIYLGNGKVIEATGAKYDGKNSKIYITYFKGDGKGCDGKRTTWTHWFKSPYLTYEIPTKEENEPSKPIEWTKGTYRLTVAKCIRRSHTLGSNIVKVKECTASTKKVLTSTNPNADAKIKVGTDVIISGTYNENGRIWGAFGNCWIVICNIDGTPQAQKIA